MSIDLMLGVDPANESGDDDWVSHHARRMQQAYEFACLQLNREADRRKKLYDQKAKEHPLVPGQCVYVRKHVRGRAKIQDAWYSQVYRVVRRQGDNAVYVVEPADGFGEAKTVNRTELRVCTQPQWIPRRAVIPPRKPGPLPNRAKTDTESDSDSDEMIMRAPALALLRRQPSAEEVRTVNNAVDSAVSPSDESDAEPVTPLRRSTRRGRGMHSNVHNEPRTVMDMLTADRGNRRRENNSDSDEF